MIDELPKAIGRRYPCPLCGKKVKELVGWFSPRRGADGNSILLAWCCWPCHSILFKVRDREEYLRHLGRGDTGPKE